MRALRRRFKPLLYLAAFGLVWAGYFIVSESSASLHQDMTEAYVWGREFRLGYNQHPPFWAWICGLWFAVLPRWQSLFLALSALNATIGLWGAWRVIGRFAAGETRIAATSLLVLSPFYTFFAFKYNANSIFLSLWPWTIYFYDRAVAQRRIGDALALGALVAAGLLSKYFALVFDATLALALFARADWRAYFRSASPYVSALVAAVLIAPHVVWLVSSGAPPLRYLGSVSGLGPLAGFNNAQATLFGALAGLAAPIVLVGFFAKDRINETGATLRRRWLEPRYRELTVLAFAPLALSLVAAVVMEVKLATVMLIGAFPLGPLWLIETVAPAPLRALARVSFRLAVALSLASLLASPLVALWGAMRAGNVKYTEPRPELADAATRYWRQTVASPLLYVAGTPYFDDALAFYSDERPHAFSGFDLNRSRWVTPALLKAHGLLAVCKADDAHCLDETKRYAGADSHKATLTLAHGFLWITQKPETFVVTAIPPG